MQGAQGNLHDWVIIGGGPHAVCAARALSAAGATLRIVEPTGQLLHRWEARAASIAMSWMRSPVGHHLENTPSSLRHFLHLPENQDVAGLAGPYLRPTHGAFLRHSHEVISRHGLEERVFPGRVSSILAEGENLRVQGEGFELRARRVLLAIGANQLRLPGWARELRQEGAPIQHLFDDQQPMSLDVLGGGISAVQRAWFVHRKTKQTVRLWMRGPLQVQEYDIDRAWTKHRFVSQWSQLDDAQRLQFFQRHPTRGSVPATLARLLANAVERGSIRVLQGLPEVRWDAARDLLVLRGEQQSIESTGLTLATGLELGAMPAWLRATVDRLSLPMYRDCPKLDEDMHWGRGIYACGPLARLRWGPMAANLVGARWATARLPGVRMQPL